MIFFKTKNSQLLSMLHNLFIYNKNSKINYHTTNSITEKKKKSIKNIEEIYRIIERKKK